ncbi:hypothetical protein DFH09DRAFT_1402615 [Mycena vulgaris]|nr:hypothetical protein DFH09DRAFT_1402615 [Mycena vulgaris]
MLEAARRCRVNDTATAASVRAVCAPEADIIVSSSDAVLFKVHCKNLEVHSVVFADAERTTVPEDGAELVALSETSDVLDLLFQYMYPQPQPDLEGVDFPLLSGLAEAAEKYEVHAALGWSRMKLKNNLSNSRSSVAEHPLEVLDYAVKHGHVSLANECAHQSMGRAAADAMAILAPDTFKTWILFYEQWQRKTNVLLSSLLSGCTGGKPELVRRYLAHPTGCHTFREDLLEFIRPIFTDFINRGPRKQTTFEAIQLEAILEIKFMSDPKM